MSAVEAKLSNTDAGLSQRMSILERRLAEIEKKLLLTPPAAWLRQTKRDSSISVAPLSWVNTE